MGGARSERWGRKECGGAPAHSGDSAFFSTHAQVSLLRAQSLPWQPWGAVQLPFPWLCTGYKLRKTSGLLALPYHTVESLMGTSRP